MFSFLITTPLGYILGFIYSFVQNYGLSIILFTLLIKLILLPLNLKQQKSMTKMQKVQPLITEIQTKYKNDQQRQAEEMQKLYKEYKVSPMGGCLPMLIQFPILIGLYQVLYKPLTYIFHCWDETQIAAMLKSLGEGAGDRMAEVAYANAHNLLNFNFFGIDLSQTPTIAFNTLLIIPVLAAVTTYVSSKIVTWINKPDKDKEIKEEVEKKPQRVLNPDPKQNKASSGSSAESMTRTMSIVGPLMTLWITFTVPAALGLYWTVSNVIQIFQTILLNGHYSKKFSSEIDEKNEQKLLEKKERIKRKNRKR